MTNLRALITGGTGFIGANLVAGLNERQIDARVLCRESSSQAALAGLNYEVVTGDILDRPADLAQAMNGCEWVFHVAAVSDYWRQGRERLYRVNVEGTKNVLAAAKTAGARRLVYTSSVAALGIPGPEQLLDETSEFNTSPERFPYGHSKHLAEIEVQKAAVAGLEAVIVNPSIVMGPRDVNLGAGSMIIEADRGWGWFYPPGGVNYVAVEDVIAGHIAAAERGRVGERYVLGGENLSHREAFTIVCQAVGRPAPWLGLPKWILPPVSWLVRFARLLLGNRIPFDAGQVLVSGEKLYTDHSKALQELDLPQTPFAESVRRAYDWYRANGYLR